MPRRPERARRSGRGGRRGCRRRPPPGLTRRRTREPPALRADAPTGASTVVVWLLAHAALLATLGWAADPPGPAIALDDLAARSAAPLGSGEGDAWRAVVGGRRGRRGAGGRRAVRPQLLGVPWRHGLGLGRGEARVPRRSPHVHALPPAGQPHADVVRGHDAAPARPLRPGRRRRPCEARTRWVRSRIRSRCGLTPAPPCRATNRGGSKRPRCGRSSPSCGTRTVATRPPRASPSKPSRRDRRRRRPQRSTEPSPRGPRQQRGRPAKGPAARAWRELRCCCGRRARRGTRRRAGSIRARTGRWSGPARRT